MTLHSEVMPLAQQKVLGKLGPVARNAGFYLGGGTAVAIHIGHRRSVDLDWFTTRKIPDPLQLAASLHSPAYTLEVGATDRGTLHAKADGVLVSFLEYQYPLLSPATDWLQFGCDLASLVDLASMKLAAVAGRGSRKDFVDVFALLRSGLTLDEMLDLYRQKYSTQDIGHVLMSLTFFDEAAPQRTIGKVFVVLGVQCVQNLGALHPLGVLLQNRLDAFERCSDFGLR